jgi:hypothetical protein
MSILDADNFDHPRSGETFFWPKEPEAGAGIEAYVQLLGCQATVWVTGSASQQTADSLRGLARSLADRGVRYIEFDVGNVVHRDGFARLEDLDLPECSIVLRAI